MPPITLTVLSGPAAGQGVTKDVAKLGLGRVKTGNVLQLKDSMVSSKHCQLEWVEAEGAWFALDLDSSNGTKLNDAERSMLQGQSYKLRSGDQLRLGPETTVLVQFEDEAAADDSSLSVEAKLTVDVERWAASIRAAAQAGAQQMRASWAEQRAALVQSCGGE